MAAHGRTVVEIDAGQVGHGADVLVATAGQADQDALLRRHGFRQLHGVRHGMAGFQHDLLGRAIFG